MALEGRGAPACFLFATDVFKHESTGGWFMLDLTTIL